MELLDFYRIFVRCRRNKLVFFWGGGATQDKYDNQLHSQIKSETYFSLKTSSYLDVV